MKESGFVLAATILGGALGTSLWVLLDALTKTQLDSGALLGGLLGAGVGLGLALAFLYLTRRDA